jgi:hypothetical protein
MRARKCACVRVCVCGGPTRWRGECSHAARAAWGGPPAAGRRRPRGIFVDWTAALRAPSGHLARGRSIGGSSEQVGDLRRQDFSGSTRRQHCGAPSGHLAWTGAPVRQQWRGFGGSTAGRFRGSSGGSSLDRLAAHSGGCSGTRAPANCTNNGSGHPLIVQIMGPGTR